jgi:hypothetical protein
METLEIEFIARDGGQATRQVLDMRSALSLISKGLAKPAAADASPQRGCTHPAVDTSYEVPAAGKALDGLTVRFICTSCRTRVGVRAAKLGGPGADPHLDLTLANGRSLRTKFVR